MPESFTFAITGAHHDTAGADAMRQLHVAMAVSHHERARQVDAAFRGSLMQHAGARSSTGASSGGYVRAIIDAVEISSDVAQLNSHQIVDGVHERFRVVSASDSRLIGDDKDEKSALV